MGSQQHTHHRSRWSKLDGSTIVERTTGPRFGVNGHLIGWQLQSLLNGRLRNEVICLASHHHRRSLCSLIWIVRQQIRQGSCVTVQAIEANDDAGERKRKSVGIGCNDAARPFEFVAIVAVPRVSKRAQKLMRMRL